MIYESFLRKFVDDGDFEFVRIKVGEIRIRESHVESCKHILSLPRQLICQLIFLAA